jgi:hypothetical protein
MAVPTSVLLLTMYSLSGAPKEKLRFSNSTCGMHSCNNLRSRTLFHQRKSVDPPTHVVRCAMQNIDHTTHRLC